jgi:hypothetical protein
MAIKLDKLVAIEQPQKTGMIDPGKGVLPIASEQVERSPTKRSHLFGPAAIEESTAIIDECLPAPQRHVARWAIGMEPGVALGPRARDAAVMLDDRRAFRLCLAPNDGCGSDRCGRFFDLSGDPT